MDFSTPVQKRIESRNNSIVKIYREKIENAKSKGELIRLICKKVGASEFTVRRVLTTNGLLNNGNS